MVLSIGSTAEHSDGTNTTWVFRASRHVLVTSTKGQFTSDAGAFALLHAAEVLEDIGSGLAAFFEWSQMTSYSSEARSAATSFMLKHRSRYRCAVFLTTSTLVSMGVNVANMALGGFLMGTTHRADFDARLTAARREDAPLADHRV